MQDAEAEPQAKAKTDEAQIDYWRLLEAWAKQKPTQQDGQSDSDFQALKDAWLDQGPSPPVQPPAPKRTRRVVVKAIEQGVAPDGASASSTLPALRG